MVESEIIDIISDFFDKIKNSRNQIIIAPHKLEMLKSIKLNTNDKIYKAVKLFDEFLQKFKNNNENSKDVKCDLIKLYCIIELLTRTEKYDNRSIIARRCGILLGQKHKYQQQLIVETINTLFTIRNTLVHEYSFPYSTKVASENSELSPSYLIPIIRNIIYLLLIRFIFVDQIASHNQLKTAWKEYEYTGLSFELPKSLFQDELESLKNLYFGDLKTDFKNYYTIGIDLYGGLIIQPKLIHRDLSILPSIDSDEEGITINLFIKHRISQFVDNFKKKINDDYQLNKNNNEMQVLYLNKAPQYIAFAFGYLYYNKFKDKTPLVVFLRYKEEDKIIIKEALIKDYQPKNPINFVFSGKNSQKEIIHIGLKNPKEQSPILYLYPESGKQQLTNVEDVYKCASGIMDKLIKKVKENHLKLSLRTATPLTVLLGYLSAKNGFSIDLFDDKEFYMVYTLLY